MQTSVNRFKHILRLTDDTGIVEHALGRIPRRKEGYSTDDQARALWACLEWLDLAGEEEAGKLNDLIDTYLAFLLWVQKDNGHFHNNIAYDRTQEKEAPSDDCLGRCLWAAALALVRLREPERRVAAETVLEKALTQVSAMRFLRGQAYAMSALSLLIAHRYPHHLMNELEMLTQRLVDAYRSQAAAGWNWFEPVVSYSNAILPWGLLNAYEVVRDNRILNVATESLDFLIRLSTNEKGQIRPVGNKGWCGRESRALWDQQPIDVMKLCLAAAKAFQITGTTRYAEIAAKCRDWFYGENDAGVSMVNAAEGSCYDGLTDTGPNLNQGAEAVISYLITEALYLKQINQKREVDHYAACTT
ncbi:glycosyl transferase [Paenibacillus cisolokensis]|uniref:Glycosyl transferase n=1 Tax=Paenibacillus cisolokensis TaxID=1658519 RepID=A0ABQ4N072_9BACL|nr:glycosyl transferase [Paenibacillus cisolokensis]GIQ61537.1 glycosyl transferase [Paenibacillus cisolokensis]